MRIRNAIPPPFRVLDPALSTAEHLLAKGDRQLTQVVRRLPDEHAAAEDLNEVLARCGAGPRLRQVGESWRMVHVNAAGRDTELVTAAGGLAELVAAAGWRRLKRCETCGQPFVDRTNGCTRRWCTPHRPRARRLLPHRP